MGHILQSEFNTSRLFAEIDNCSQLSLCVLCECLWSWFWEQVWSEFGCLRHVSIDLHLALHKCHLWVQSSHADLFKVIISHCEGSICFCGLSLLAVSIPILHVDLVDQRWLCSLLCCDLETKH